MSEKNSFDVIVVGSGPAGSSAAVFCSNKGFRVLLLDKEFFPRDKTCGDGISGKSVSLLKELGMNLSNEKVERSMIKSLTLSSPKGEIVKLILGEREETHVGFCCPRKSFDNLLYENAKKQENVTALNGFTATDLLWEGKQIVGIKGITKEGIELKFNAKIVVACDGANSVLRKKYGLFDSDKNNWIIALRAYYDDVEISDENSIELHFIEGILPGYFWIFPVSKTKANVGLGIVESFVGKKNLKLKEEMLKAIEENPLFKERFKNAKIISEIKGWRLPIASRHRKNYGNGILFCGDAAGLIDPFTGEGIGNALLSGKIASVAVQNAFAVNDFSESTLTEFDELLWSKELRAELKKSTNLMNLSKYSFLLNYVIGKAAKNKAIADYLSESIKSGKYHKKIGLREFLLKLLLG
ncbi:MAG: geranylgeranyl reductase family protein [Candidatus Diapherotrites archaeon]